MRQQRGPIKSALSFPRRQSPASIRGGTVRDEVREIAERARREDKAARRSRSRGRSDGRRATAAKPDDSAALPGTTEARRRDSKSDARRQVESLKAAGAGAGGRARNAGIGRGRGRPPKYVGTAAPAPSSASAGGGGYGGDRRGPRGTDGEDDDDEEGGGVKDRERPPPASRAAAYDPRAASGRDDSAARRGGRGAGSSRSERGRSLDGIEGGGSKAREGGGERLCRRIGCSIPGVGWGCTRNVMCGCG